MVVTAQRDIQGARTAAQCVVEVHRRLADFLAPGQTLARIDRFVAGALADLDSRSAFLHYRMRSHPPFPSHACLSLNDCIVHGTHDMSPEPIRAGDVLSVDIGVVRDGWIGDQIGSGRSGRQVDHENARRQKGHRRLRDQRH